MIALDTNVIIRILVDDPQHSSQNDQARALVGKHSKFFISSIVVTEMVWVLDRAFHFKKTSIIKALEEISENNAFVLENQDDYNEALVTYRKSNVDFSDSLILSISKRYGVKKLYTFDKKLSKLHHAVLVE